ncbi:MAG: S8 family serine peptidase, partial [Bdellovibrionota bacterium]|nr:S8 family serine peptidase [Bdellovibrionota bacterium]
MPNFSLNVLLVLACFLITLSTNAFSTTPPHSKNRIIVKFLKDKIPNDLANKKGLIYRKLFPHVYTVSGKTIDQMEKIFKENKNVDYVEKDFKGNKNKFKNIIPTNQQSFLSEPNTASFFKDPMAKKQWHLNSSKKYGSSIEEAYKKRIGDKKEEVIVAIVDTGIDYKHEDLINNIWINKNEIPNNQKDDDGNGYIDDYYGINTLVRDSEGKATTDPMDTHGHGTHVAGIIGAVQNNGKGVAGISEKIKLMGIRTVPSRGDEKDVDVIEAFVYA